VDDEEKATFNKELLAASPGKNDGFTREKYYKVSSIYPRSLPDPDLAV
jgi:hypothetical protein